MKRETLIGDIKEFLLSRRAILKGFLNGELANLGTDEDEEYWTTKPTS